MSKVVVCVCVVLLATTPAAFAQEGAGEVVGYVTGAEQGGALAGATVTLDGLPQRTATDYRWWTMFGVKASF